MGEVWLGYDRLSRRAVAVKLVHREGPGGRYAAESVQRFVREVQFLQRLRHHGIPEYFDAQSDPGAGELYLVMEHIRGRTLAEITAGGRVLPEREVVSIAARICEVLEHLHAVPVIHRDLKPSNIMRVSRERLVLLDFGVARMFRIDQVRLTTANRVLGTVAYMPPEHVGGQEVTPRSDLYSLSCVLYELLTGIPPFPGDDVTEVMRWHKHREPKPVSLLRPGVAPALEAVIMAGLAKRADDRPTSAREFRERLGPPGRGTATSAPQRTSVRKASGCPVPTTSRPLRVRITQAQALLDGGLLGDAMPRFAELVEELAACGPERVEEAARCRLGYAHCRARYGFHREAFDDLTALKELLQPGRRLDDPLMLDVRFRIGQLQLALDDLYGINEIAEVYEILVAAGRPEDVTMVEEVRLALNRATLG